MAKECLCGNHIATQFPVPVGWFVFGTHVDQPVRLEFSEEGGEDGLPWWERPHALMQIKDGQ